MSHATHFLSRLERLDEAQVAFALSLYRNVPLVKELVAKAAPEGSGRVAIAVSPHPDGPHVVVARDGAFVTCLGAGMRTELPIISRAAVDKAAAASAELRRQLAIADELQRTPNWPQRALRIHDGPLLPREVAEDVMRWSPVLSREYLRLLVENQKEGYFALQRLKAKEQLKPKHRGDVLELWCGMWAGTHLLGPAAAWMRGQLAKNAPGEPPGYVGYLGVTGLILLEEAPAMRGAWALAELGEVGLERLVRTWFAPRNVWDMWACGLGLVTLGLRERRFRQRIAGELAKTPTHPLFDASDAKHLEHLRDVLAHPEAALERHLARGTEVLRRRLGDTGDLDATTLLAGVALEERRLAGAADYTALIDTLPFVAAAQWHELYVPQAVLARLPPIDPESAAWEYATRRVPHEGAEPAKAPATPGRNDPCSCGSGKKFKKCCGA